jgi:2-iminobutanoate/2-iminopropanoate deaminase
MPAMPRANTSPEPAGCESREVAVSREIVNSPEAPKAAGPYSQAVCAGGLIFCSGQIPIEPGTGALAQATAAEAVERCLLNLAAVLRAARARLEDAVQVTLYLADMADFAEANEAYTRFFPSGPPARICVGVSSLPKGARVEIAAIAARAE